ncbi:unnamed protein product [Dovyalis caffra]|uniref:Uncharacterized protein n=1 Tax=Dovyalis caffra TaxID=77055 RepID=A0AAV1SQ88_9ROSI|nr:unnamed protein product [Dovyalis caffra]
MVESLVVVPLNPSNAICQTIYQHLQNEVFGGRTLRDGRNTITPSSTCMLWLGRYPTSKRCKCEAWIHANKGMKKK